MLKYIFREYEDYFFKSVLCPSEKAYGKRGAGGRIPPDSDLYFEIWMLGFGKHKVEDL